MNKSIFIALFILYNLVPSFNHISWANQNISHQQYQEETSECELDDEAAVIVLVDPAGRCKIEGVEIIFPSHKEMVEYVTKKMFPGKKVAYFEVEVKTLD